MSQSCLTFALPPLVNHAWLYLATISQLQINYFFATISQTWLIFALPPSVRHGWLSLPSMSRTPCPVATNVLDIQHLHLRALYIVHFSRMNIAVCKQVPGSLTLDTVCIWKLTQSWTLYHLCDAISISIKQMSLSHHMWHICWCGRKNIIMFSWLELIQSGIVVENKLSSQPDITHRVDHKTVDTQIYKLQTSITAHISHKVKQKHWELKGQ